MGHDIITDEQVEAFERDGVVTVDTPWSGKLIEDVSEIMDRQLPISADKMNLPGEKPQRYRIKRDDPLEEPYVRIIEDPFLEVIAKRLLHSESVNLRRVALRNTYPEPTTEFKVDEHTDITVSMADLASTPRRMSVGMFLWITDVDEKCAPLMVRPGSHRQIAESMGDNPRYIHGTWDKDDFINAPDETSHPIGIYTSPGQWPELDYADFVPCLARAGQVTILNAATIHGPSTNIGQTNRKTMIISMRPTSVEIGENKNRSIHRQAYVQQLKTILSPGRLSILPD